MPKHSPLILIVDDDDQVLDSAEIVLTALDYRVIPATNADAALEIVKYYRGIDLLITDIVMPGSMDGWELARRAKEIRSELRVLYTSGFASRALPERDAGYGPLLPKPWRAPELVRTVHRSLRGARRDLMPV
ncbi:MAG TPA: response regulator [Stellaceae bacterium]